MDWIGILKNLGFFTVLTTALGFLSRSLIKQVLNRQIEEFKHNLEMRAFEHKVIFSNLHEKRAEIIISLYSKLYNTSDTLAKLIKSFVRANDLSEIKRNKIAVNTFNDLIHYFGENEIFFNEETCSLLNKFILENKEVIRIFRSKDFTQETMPLVDEWNAALDKFEGIEKIIKKELKGEFRAILGVK